MRNKDVSGELAYMLTAQYGCAFSLTTEHQPDHFDVLTFPSSRSQRCRVCPVGAFVVLRGETSSIDGEVERHPR